jgi:hypothetical protein
MSQNTTNASAYVPGVCNINKEEIAQRRKAGYFGLFSSIVYLGLCLTLTDMIWWRLLLVAPVFIAAIGFLQASNKFCVSYGTSGKQNAEPASQQAHTVTNEASLVKDRVKARKMNLQALAIAIVVSLVSLALPGIA